jgi:pimeloyl-ACP methyl ester carboxylesterase
MEQPHISTTQLQSIRVPVLVMSGDHEIIKAKHTSLIPENISKSYLCILPDSGHAVPLVYKDLFNQLVSKFFEKSYTRREKIGRMF